MAGLTRKFIKDAAKDAGIEIPAEMIDAIIGAHVESRDAAIETAVKPLNEQLEAAKTGGEDKGFKAKYEAEHTALEALKAEITTKETTAKKTAAVKALLAEAKISEKRHDIVVKSLLPDFDKIELDKDGKIKDVDALKTSITTDWAEFIETTEKKPSPTPTPPIKQTGDTKEAEVVARVRTAMGLPPETA
ncbi:MAG: hypothetical protein EOM03_07885 [Clostridia bacterium]|nr:hypothetical protein [Clostridia bacterium]